MTDKKTPSPEPHVTGISRELMGKIVDEVFDGAIEDARVIEEIYAVIKRHEAAPQQLLRVTAEVYNAAFDPANEALGNAFMAGFREGWIYAEIDADGERYQETAEEYSLAVDTAPGEAWDAHRAKFFAMLPLAAIPTVGTPIVDKEAEIARVVQSVNEWDDRTSPDDYPDHLLISSEELAEILRAFFRAVAGSESGQ